MNSTLQTSERKPSEGNEKMRIRDSGTDAQVGTEGRKPKFTVRIKSAAK